LVAGAASTHDSFDVTGTVFACPTHTYTYTVTSGAIKEVMHESVDASGITHFTVTDTADQIRLVDEDGNAYSLTGAIWFGGRDAES
jgi:nitrite reductase/ring-hydroxylating ferredoxin subunit